MTCSTDKANMHLDFNGGAFGFQCHIKVNALDEYCSSALQLIWTSHTLVYKTKTAITTRTK